MSNSSLQHGSLDTVIGVAMRVAQMHGTSMSLVDLEQLLPAGTTPEEISRALEVISGPGKYIIADGLIVPTAAAAASADDFATRLRNSKRNVAVARSLTKKLGRREALTVAVSGSTSYKAASWRDDVDLFFVTRPQKMWLLLAKALVLTRTFRIMGEGSAPICLSCVVDADFARGLFNEDRGALFARDALIAQVLDGPEEYEALLHSAPWMEKYFPKLYLSRTSSPPTLLTRNRPSVLDRVMNLFMFATVGTYVAAKSYVHNRQLMRTGKDTARFRARLGVDHLIYESEKYLQLKEIYNNVGPAQTGQGAQGPI